MEPLTRDQARQRVLAVAGELFAEHGFEDVTMADIAAEAGVARATVFNYFGSKYALVEAMTVGVLEVYVEMLEELLEDEGTPVPVLLRRVCKEMAEGIESERAFFRGVFRDIGRVRLGLHEGEAVQDANEHIRRRVLALIERGQERGELNDAFAAATLADAFHSLANGTITDWLYNDVTAPLVKRMEEAADIFLSPIAMPDGRSRRKRGST